MYNSIRWDYFINKIDTIIAKANGMQTVHRKVSMKTLSVRIFYKELTDRRYFGIYILRYLNIFNVRPVVSCVVFLLLYSHSWLQ